MTTLGRILLIVAVVGILALQAACGLSIWRECRDIANGEKR